MNLNIWPRIKWAIKYAVAFFRCGRLGLTMNTAYHSAMGTIVTHERTALQPDDHEGFFLALDTPPTPSDRLRTAFARYREAIISQ